MAKKKNSKKDDSGLESLRIPATRRMVVELGMIKPNLYNCNVMDEDEYKALKGDMAKTNSMNAMEPVLLRKLGKHKYEIVDGEHRFRAAKELGWDLIDAKVFPEGSVSQESALLLNFRINRQRGTHDPMKEARFFRYLTKEVGLTQGKVGEFLNIDRTTVAKRISILKIDDELLELDGTRDVPVSVLEVVAQAETKDVQASLLTEYQDGFSTVEELQDALEEHKKELEEERKFREMMEKAKFPNCPNCGQPATSKLWYDDRFVTDGGGYDHTWNPRTGRTRRQMEQADRASAAGQKGAKVISVFKSGIEVDELVSMTRQTFLEAALAVFEQADRIVVLMDDPKDYSDKGVSFSRNYQGSPEISITADQGTLHVVCEPKNYQSGHNTKVIVSEPSPYQEGGLARAEKLFNMLLEGKLTFKKIGTKGKKKTKKKRGRKK